ncbi:MULTISPECIES: hypothetical protein [unclassified Streptomyces]|uniref:hypothetical protein n=1 Tax=unclassified Streptomyces TaxID=2593676 RepID=UPI0036B4D100
MAFAKKRVGGKNGGATDGYSVRPEPILEPNPHGNRAERRAAKKAEKKPKKS